MISKLNEIKISYSNKTKKADRVQIKTSEDVVPLLRNIFEEHIDYKEIFCLLCLNRANEVLGYSVISTGGVAGTVVDLKIIFQIALKSHSSGIIVSHNHPSSNVQPSKQDTELTHKIHKAGKLLDITLLDHIIITREEHYSFAVNGNLII